MSWLGWGLPPCTERRTPPRSPHGGVLLLTLARGSVGKRATENPRAGFRNPSGDLRSMELQFAAETAQGWPFPSQSMSSGGRAFKSASLVTPLGLVQPLG